ncbi:MAG: roadblock/LC7 domain-containing protein [Candidatus Aenigmarchaeota archaeon]|nr:roadblock/LC7 domain-containing protein [Candidatus Aenigmarchaeota archaeon]
MLIALLLLAPLANAQNVSAFLDAQKDLKATEAKIAEAKGAGKGVDQAQALLQEAKRKFIEGDYSKSLELSMKSREEIERALLQKSPGIEALFPYAPYAVLLLAAALLAINAKRTPGGKKRKDALQDELEDMRMIGGVIGAVVARDDGLLIGSSFLRTQNAGMIAAMSAQVVKNSKITVRELGMEKFQHTMVMAAKAQYVAFEKDSIILLVLVDKNVNIGLILNAVEKKLDRLRSLVDLKGTGEQQLHVTMNASVGQILASPQSFVGKKVSIKGCEIHEMEPGVYVIADFTGAITGYSEADLKGKGSVDGIIQLKKGKPILEF